MFVDTGAWVALAVEDDLHHEETAGAYPALFKKYILVTTNLVVAETYILLRKASGHGPAISFLEMIELSPRIRKVYSTAPIEEEAIELLRRYADQDFSFTDAVSFVVMERLKMREAFAFDGHFSTMGFILIP